MLVETVLSLLLLVCLYLTLRKPPKLPPGVWGLPVVGTFPSSTQRFGDQVKALRSSHGDIITWRVGGRVLIFLCNLKLIKRALGKLEFSDRPDFKTYTTYTHGSLKGLIFSNGSPWHIHRRFVLRQLRDLGMGKSKIELAIQEEAALLVQDFRKHTGRDEPVSLSLGVAVLNVIWKMVADTRFEMDDPRLLDFIQLLTEMTREFEGSVTLFNFLPWLGKIAPVWLQQQLGLVTLQKTTEKLANFAEESVKQHEDTLDPLHRRDLIDQYLMSIKEDQDPLFKREELLMLVTDLFFAGAETTSSTILWTILYLAKYPGVQERVQQEIDDVLPKGITPQYQDRTKLPYFEAMLSEVQRVVSLVPLGVPHMATQDTEFEGYTIPKGAVLMPHIECCHNDPELWEKPDQFYPEHFLDADGKYANREGLMPFAVGRRACVGESLARVELVIFMVSLLQQFTFTAPKGESLSTEHDPKELVFNAPQRYRITITER